MLFSILAIIITLLVAGFAIMTTVSHTQAVQNFVSYFLMTMAGTKQHLGFRSGQLGLSAFCKTTGGKGLHVVAPLKATRSPIGWGEAKAFTEAVSTAMAEDSPDHYLVGMAKKRRTGRIFLDYLRNDRTATAVAPLSPRARSGAPVAMPLNWDQLRKDLDPSRFTIESAPDLLARIKPWTDYDRAARPLAPAMRKLARIG
jgi:bifunctional non-homologous end joining protein LigD